MTEKNEKIYCFDFDGVICFIDDDEYALRSPNYDTFNIMHALIDTGHTVIIHTGRHIDKLHVTKMWLEKYRVPYDHLQFGKPVADLYIDDKGLKFEGTWTQSAIESLR